MKSSHVALPDATRRRLPAFRGMCVWVFETRECVMCVCALECWLRARACVRERAARGESEDGI